jgi:hypothetical protein
LELDGPAKLAPTNRPVSSAITHNSLLPPPSKPGTKRIGCILLTPEQIDYAISSAISEVLTEHGVDKGDVSIVYGAMPVESQLVHSLIARNLHKGVTVHVCKEFVLSLFGAIQEDFGALVQAGTGSFTAQVSILPPLI